MARWPLNWLDRRLLYLQGPDRPWSILLQVGLDRPVDPDDLRAAWTRTLAARPELGVVLGDDPTWVAGPTDPVLNGTVESILDRPARPDRDPAVALVPDADPSVFSVVVNHALTDGLGSLAIVDDVLRSLAGAEPAERSPVTDHHLDRLRTTRPALRTARAQVPPLRVVSVDAPAAPTRLTTRSFDAGPVIETARRLDVAVTALLVAAAARVLDHPDHRGRRTRGTVAVGVPADLRRHIGEPAGIGNAVVNVAVTGRRTRSAGSVAATLATATTARRLGEALTWIHRATRPGRPRSTPRSGRSVAGLVVSNLGPTPVGPHWDPVRTLGFAPPAHQTTSVGVVGVSDRLSVTVRGRHDDTEHVADAFVDALEKLSTARSS